MTGIWNRKVDSASQSNSVVAFKRGARVDLLSAIPECSIQIPGITTKKSN